jgi:hypothetical protein
MEIDEKWQTRRKCIKISEEDRAFDIDEDLMNEITTQMLQTWIQKD